MEKSTYALMIYRSAAGAAPLPKHVEEAVLAAHRDLQAESAARGELRAAVRLNSDPGKTVKNTSGAHEVMDGPYVEAKEWLAGFYLVDCRTEAEALERARNICPDSSHVIEVRPVAWQWEPNT